VFLIIFFGWCSHIIGDDKHHVQQLAEAAAEHVFRSICSSASVTSLSSLVSPVSPSPSPEISPCSPLCPFCTASFPCGLSLLFLCVCYPLPNRSLSENWCSVGSLLRYLEEMTIDTTVSPARLVDITIGICLRHNRSTQTKAWFSGFSSPAAKRAIVLQSLKNNLDFCTSS
jgi:hypothetical protein